MKGEPKADQGERAYRDDQQPEAARDERLEPDDGIVNEVRDCPDRIAHPD